jgi:hypothetical protein
MLDGRSIRAVFAQIPFIITFFVSDGLVLCYPRPITEQRKSAIRSATKEIDRADELVRSGLIGCLAVITKPCS